MITLTLLALFLLSAVAARAALQPDPSGAPLLWELRGKRVSTDDERSKRCLPPAHRKYRLAVLVPVLERPVALRREVDRLRIARSAGLHRCRPTSPRGIIRYVFPDSTEDAALRVAYCESRLYPYARNPSGASGLFQLMPGHWRGRFDPFDPWANTRYAYRLSDRGYNWSAWVCRP